MRRFSFYAPSVCAAVLLVFVGSAAAELIRNGSFEERAIGGLFAPTPTGNRASELGVNATTIIGRVLEQRPAHWWSNGVIGATRNWTVVDNAGDTIDGVTDGVAAVMIDTLAPFYLYQDGIDLEAGHHYDLRFDVWGGDFGRSGGEGVFVFIDDGTGGDTPGGSVQLAANFTTDGSDGLAETIEVGFTATQSGTFRLTFRRHDPPLTDFNHVLIDRVSLVSMPEPSSLIGFSIGAALLSRRRR